MNEKELKLLFWHALNSGHVKNNTIIPSPSVARLRVVEEANFRSFDLIVAAIGESPGSAIGDENYELLARTRLLTQFAKQEKCRPDRIQFYPIELKSDEDTIDERLPNQIIDAILTFGLSLVVLDKNHSRRVKSSGLFRMLPATMICYSGTEDYFEVISVFDRFVSSGIFDFDRVNLARLLQRNGGPASAKAFRRLEQLQQILQKIIFSQLHFTNPGLTDEEQHFVCALAEIGLPKRKSMIAEILKDAVNAKMTDYM
jgi:hypothetical protein